MTKKDFERAAEIVRTHIEAGDRVKEVEMLAEAFVAFFTGSNPRFDAGRFRSACYSPKG